MIEIDYSVQISSQLRISTGIGSVGHLDNTIVRDSNRQAYIPGSTIKGKVRAAYYRFAKALGVKFLHRTEQEPAGCLVIEDSPCLVCQVFGAAQWPGGLNFGNAGLQSDLQSALLHLDEELLRDDERPIASLNFGQQTRTNVAIDRRRRVALPDQLFTFESIGKPAAFQGRISGQISSENYRQAVALLAASLQSITHLGGGRGRGAGRCECSIDAVSINSQDSDLQALMGTLDNLGGAG